MLLVDQEQENLLGEADHVPARQRIGRAEIGTYALL